MAKRREKPLRIRANNVNNFISLEEINNNKAKQTNKVNNNKLKVEEEEKGKKYHYAVSRYAVTSLPVTPLHVLP